MTSKSSMVVGALSGVALGFAVRAVVSKRDNITAKCRELDQRLYEDGRRQAEKISQIKQDVHEQVGQP